MKVLNNKCAQAAIILAFYAVCSARAESPTPSDQIAANAAPPPALTLSSNSSVWKDGVGNGFKKGAQELGVGVLYAPSVKILGTSATHNLVLGYVEAGWMITDVVFENCPIRGNWEVLAQPYAGMQVNNAAYLVGFDGFIRYNFATGTRFVPFFQGGLGVLLTDIGGPDLGGLFQFSEKAGIGTKYFFSDDFSVNFELRFMHISNASIRSPNRGLNAIPFCLSVSYFF